MAGQKNLQHRKKARQEKAILLAEERAKRTDIQQLQALDKKLGKDKGAKKERALLHLNIKKTTTKKGEKKNANA